MGKSQEFKHRTKQNNKEIAAYLRKLSDGFDSGTINLDNSIEQMLLNPAGIIDMELKAKTDGDKCKIEIEIKWALGKERNLSISAKA